MNLGFWKQMEALFCCRRKPTNNVSDLHQQSSYLDDDFFNYINFAKIRAERMDSVPFKKTEWL